MQTVPWDQVHANKADFRSIFNIADQPRRGATGRQDEFPILFNSSQWNRIYPYVPLPSTGTTTTTTLQDGPKRIRIVGPALRFKDYVSGTNTSKFVLSAMVTLNVQFLHFLETFDSAIEQQVKMLPGYEQRKFQGLLKTTQNTRVLEFPIDENTDFFICDRISGEIVPVNRVQAIRTFTISRAPCRPQFRVEGWYINRIFQSVRLKIVCESLTFYPSRDWMLTPSRSLESLQHRYNVYRETGYDVDIEDERLVEELEEEALQQQVVGSSSTSSTATTAIRSTTVISVESDEEKRRNWAIKENIQCGWCPPLTEADAELTVEWEDENACCICLCNHCNAYLSPCEHRCVCIPCAQQLMVRQCPICRTRVEKVLRVVGRKK